MKASYLKNVLKAGVGTNFSKDNQTILNKMPSSSSVHLQQPIRNRPPFFTTLRDNQNELEDMGESITLGEFFEDTSFTEKPGIIGNQDSQDDPLSARKKKDVGLHSTTELKMGETDMRRKKKKIKEDEGGLQEIEEKIDDQKLKVKKIQHREKERIPSVEIVKQEAIQIPMSNQFGSPNLISKLAGINTRSQNQNEKKKVKHLKKYNSQKMELPKQLSPQTLKNLISDPQKEKMQVASDVAKQQQLQPRKTSIAELQKDRLRITSDIVEQKKVHESETLMKTIGVSQKPRGQRNLKPHFFSQSLKENETQMNKISRDIALIKKRLYEHISKDQSVLTKTAFLPKRPPSNNLGGWSILERNYVR